MKYLLTKLPSCQHNCFGTLFETCLLNKIYMQKGSIRVQTENIFPIIKKFLYSDHEIFIRELVSNAVDATQKIKTLYDYVTNEFFLNIASQYFGEKPLLVELKVLVSPPSSESNLKGSQLWHSDFSDTKLLKIFIFIEDVDSNSGPLEIIC